jgi:hypothetical protein
VVVVAGVAGTATARAADSQDPPATPPTSSDTASNAASAAAQPSSNAAAPSDSQPQAQVASGDSTPQPDPAPTANNTGAAPGANGNGNGNGPVDKNPDANGNGNANGHAKADADSTQTQPGNTSVTGRVDQAGDNGGVSQNNAAQADAAAGASNNAGPAQADASANASQASPSNVNVSARVNSPGDDGPVQQSNAASANAGAGAAGGAGSQAAADANADQSSPLNVNVSVRVNSPGDQRPVSQTNSADATAAGIDPQSTAGTTNMPSDPAGTNKATIDNSADVGQLLEQCGDNCAPLSTSPAAADAGAGVLTDTSAAASQVSPTNLNVSVRVDSSGDSADPSQTNAATADATTATATTTGGRNINVSVDVNGSGPVTAPSSSQPWTWTWNWSLGAPVPPNSAQTNGNNWNWNWPSPTAPLTTNPESAITPVAGHWIWRWTWTNGDQSAGFISDQPCSCTWVWDWVWTGSPAQTSQSSAPAATSQEATTPTVTQTNSAVASASANATTTIGQTAASTTDAANSGSQATDQSVISSQDVTAVAVVVQTGADNASFVSSDFVVTVDQTNAVASVAVARAGFTAIQAVSQTQSAAGDGALHRQGAVQEIDNLQSAFASARAVQSHSRNHSEVSSKKTSVTKILAVVQLNFAQAAALATSISSILQILTQVQVGGGANHNQTQTADQWAANIQVAEASSEVAQSFVGNIVDVDFPAGGLTNKSPIWKTPLTQSNTVGVASQMTNTSSIEQAITQMASGPVTWIESAEQSAKVVQTGTASALATQPGRFNIVSWNGPITAAPTSQPASTLEPLQTVAAPRAFAAGQTADRAVDDSVRPRGGAATGTTGLPRHPNRHVSTKPSKGGHGASSDRTRFVVGSTTGAPMPSAAPERSTPRATTPHEPAPLICLRALCRDGLQLGGLTRSPSTGAFAALTRPFKLAAPGVGRLLDYAPTLGRSVDIAAFERPG